MPIPPPGRRLWWSEKGPADKLARRCWTKMSHPVHHHPAKGQERKAVFVRRRRAYVRLYAARTRFIPIDCQSFRAENMAALSTRTSSPSTVAAMGARMRRM